MAEHLSLSQASSVFVAGHRGLVGSAITRRLEALGCRTLLVRSHSELDLCEQEAVDRFNQEHTTLLRDRFPVDLLSIPHQIWALIARSPGTPESASWSSA